jgi:hypothetical protein
MATSWPGFEIATVIASDTCLVFIYTDYYYLVHLNPKEIEEEEQKIVPARTKEDEEHRV